MGSKHAAALLQGTWHGSYSLGLVVHRQQLSDAEVDGAHEAEGRGWRDIHAADMVWVVIAVFAYFRRMHRLLGRCFASVHKARRKRRGAGTGTARQLATASAGCGERVCVRHVTSTPALALP